MRNFNIINAILFVLFFSIGAAILSVSVLSEEWVRLCQNKGIVRRAEQDIEKLEQLNEDYRILLEYIDSDPNFAERLAGPVLGTESNDPNTTRLKGTPRQLDAARIALAEPQKETKNDVPDWLKRCNDNRLVLFICGAVLTLIAFLFFSGKNRE